MALKFSVSSPKSFGLYISCFPRAQLWRKSDILRRTEQHCRNLGFLQSCARRNHDILQTEVAVTCSHLAAICLSSLLQVAASGSKMENQNAHLLRAQSSTCGSPSIWLGCPQTSDDRRSTNEASTLITCCTLCAEPVTLPLCKISSTPSWKALRKLVVPVAGAPS